MHVHSVNVGLPRQIQRRGRTFHELARRALATEALPEGWRTWIAERLESSG